MENISELSNVSKDTIIGEGSKIWHFCNLYGCTIGRNTQIGSYCEIKKDASIGDNCRFQSYVFVPEGTIIKNNVFVGPRVTFLNDKHPTAKKAIEGTWNLEAVIVEDEVSIGGGAIILPRVHIGKGSIIAAGALVTRDVPDYSVVAGQPSRIIGNSTDKKYEEYKIR